MKPGTIGSKCWQIVRLIVGCTIVSLAYRAVLKPASLQDQYWQSIIDDVRGGILLGLGFYFLGPHLGRMLKPKTGE